MGLFSNLFGGSRQAEVYVMGEDHTPVWEPTGPPEEFTGEDADMDDGGQAPTAEGFWTAEVTFEAADVPGARIIASAYVSYGPGEDYSLGLRYQYASEDEPDWSYIGYTGDPGGETYPSAWDAQVDALEWALLLARPGDDHSRQLLPDVFDWDGEPFPVGDPG